MANVTKPRKNNDRTAPAADAQPEAAGGSERVPPQDMNAEQCVLSGMLLSKDAIVDVQTTKLKPSDFYRPAHETIYRAILDLWADNEPADPITVANELTKRGEITRVGGNAYLHTLVNVIPIASNAEYYAEIVQELGTLRRVIEAASGVLQSAYNRDGEVADICDAAQSAILSVTAADAEVDAPETPAQLSEPFFTYLQDVEKNKGKITGVSTGLVDLDSLTTGLQPGQVIVVAGRPAMGKTTLGLDFMRACSIREKKHTLFFSLEMNKMELMSRLYSAEAQVGLHKMRSGNMTEDDWTRLARRMPEVNEAPLYIDDSANQNLNTIRAKCRRQQAAGGLSLVVIDYLQLLGSGGRYENRQVEVSDMSRKIKLLAKDLEVPIVLLAQLNRGPEQRTDKKPMISDLRESGSIEQDADIVILLHREDAYDKDSPRAGEADIIVGKHRNGPTSTITVAFQGHYSRFVDMAGNV